MFDFQKSILDFSVYGRDETTKSDLPVQPGSCALRAVQVRASVNFSVGITTKYGIQNLYEFANIALNYGQIPPIDERLPCLSWTLDRQINYINQPNSFFIETVIVSFTFQIHVDQFHGAIQNVTHPKLSPSLSAPTELTESSSNIINYPQISSNILNYPQISSIIANYRQLSSIRQSNSDGESGRRALQIIFKII